MVWYVPPLSPVLEFAAGPAGDGDPDDVFPAIDDLHPDLLPRQPARGRGRRPVRLLKRQAAMRRVMRERNLGEGDAVAAEVGLSFAEIEEMYRLLALDNSERYVIREARPEPAATSTRSRELWPTSGPSPAPRSRRSTW